ncbi:MAG TPA: hypothetical protein PLN56_04840 [Methanoregulaceae archaeon]|nr:MAG: hypothetical protein IPI71_06415 [Methanolinea sp.]HON81504.1 hypothetical protein [Methanoregulaceae archaeon]HPD10310.1 hypothetical protein [Methanoregulaceae archaeon]HRT15460.1 hypothetical protein [Methanoregulaceae archaeon]HRU30933.1 hypothetical protein [Methanoregulaceae archaeon]
MITMGKRLSFPTRSFGSDAVLPDLALLTAWVAERRGREGDLISFLLERALRPQLDAGISLPCAGGSFYSDRWRQAINGIEDGVVTGELECRAEDVARDAEDLIRVRRGLFVAIPGPHLLGLQDRYYQDRGEAGEALFSVYRSLMREQRDAGVDGHVLFCERVHRPELEALARRKVFFFPKSMTRKSLSLLLEYQQTIAVWPSGLSLLSGLIDDYEVHRVVLLNPDAQDFRQALQLMDPDQIFCGGYCRESCDEYWTSLVKSAELLI